MADDPALHIPAAYIRDVIAVAGRYRATPDALLAGLPLTMDALAVPATRIPIPVAAAIVERAVRLTGNPALAVSVGMEMKLPTHGFLGFAAMTSGTMREAGELAVRFSGTRTTALALALSVEGDSASLAIIERAPLGPLREFAVISVFVALWRIAETLVGTPLADGVAECDFTPPEPLATILRATGRLRFGQPANRLVFPAALLDLPLVNADPLASQLARGELERELSTVADAGVPGLVRAAITARRDSLPDLAEVARALHLSPRSVKRKLAEHGTTFSDILEDVRRERALLLLANRDLTIGEIATRLGYSEQPNFTRAFRRWTGMTPAAYRAGLRPQLP